MNEKIKTSALPTDTPESGDFIVGVKMEAGVPTTSKFPVLSFLPYTVLVGLITQGGAVAPVMSELENTTGQTFTWVREDAGLYYLQNAIINTTTFISGSSVLEGNEGFVATHIFDTSGTLKGYVSVYAVPSANRIYLRCIAADGATLTDLSNLINSETYFFPEVRFYP